MHDDTTATSTARTLAPRLRHRLAAWLRRRGRPTPSPSAPPDRLATKAPPPSPLRPQPEDDASIYPLF
ncbi:hypothetical protein ACFVT2_25015 [Streptomyces sp. NPDC058000]|uniref:hypothetical protein n=1 Tax=Streptomyces sp. NPDC058000 TaxID=3346299 RepID=UPI0036EC360C